MPTKLVPPSPEVIKDLSTDQSSLLYHVQWIATGVGNEKKSMAALGKLCHSRWLTLAIRVLAYFARLEKPSISHVILVCVIQQAYAPFWFEYKKTKNFIDAPAILLKLIKAIQTLELPEEVDSELRDQVIDAALEPIRRNSFCLLGENFLTSMVFDKDAKVRRRGIDKVLELKRPNQEPALKGVKHQIPDVDAWTWDKLIDLDKINPSNTSVPPCLSQMSVEDL